MKKSKSRSKQNRQRSRKLRPATPKGGQVNPNSSFQHQSYPANPKAPNPLKIDTNRKAEFLRNFSIQNPLKQYMRSKKGKNRRIFETDKIQDNRALNRSVNQFGGRDYSHGHAKTMFFDREGRSWVPEEKKVRTRVNTSFDFRSKGRDLGDQAGGQRSDLRMKLAQKIQKKSFFDSQKRSNKLRKKSSRRRTGASSKPGGPHEWDQDARPRSKSRSKTMTNDISRDFFNPKYSTKYTDQSQGSAGRSFGGIRKHQNPNFFSKRVQKMYTTLKPIALKTALIQTLNSSKSRKRASEGYKQVEQTIHNTKKKSRLKRDKRALHSKKKAVSKNLKQSSTKGRYPSYRKFNLREILLRKAENQRKTKFSTKKFKSGNQSGSGGLKQGRGKAGKRDELFSSVNDRKMLEMSQNRRQKLSTKRQKRPRNEALNQTYDFPEDAPDRLTQPNPHKIAYNSQEADRGYNYQIKPKKHRKKPKEDREHKKVAKKLQFNSKSKNKAQKITSTENQFYLNITKIPGLEKHSRDQMAGKESSVVIIAATTTEESQKNHHRSKQFGEASSGSGRFERSSRGGGDNWEDEGSSTRVIQAYKNNQFFEDSIIDNKGFERVKKGKRGYRGSQRSSRMSKNAADRLVNASLDYNLQSENVEVGKERGLQDGATASGSGLDPPTEIPKRPKNSKREEHSAEESKQTSGVFRGLESSSHLMNGSSLDRGLMFSQLNLNNSSSEDVLALGAEYKISQIVLKIFPNGPHSSNRYYLNNITNTSSGNNDQSRQAMSTLIAENWADCIFILKQKFMTLSYLNCFNEILDIIQAIFGDIWFFVETQNFKILFGEDYPFKYRENTHNIQRVLNPTKNELISNNISLKERLRSNHDMEPEEKEMLLARVSSLDHEHLYFFRKVLNLYFHSLDYFVNSLSVDYSKLVEHLISLIHQLRVIYKDSEILMVYAFTNFFEQLGPKIAGFEPEHYEKIARTYLSLLDDVLYQNVEFYRGDSNRFIHMDTKMLRVSRTVGMVFKYPLYNSQMLNTPGFRHVLTTFLQTLKEYCINQHNFIGTQDNSKAVIIDLFATLFHFLKYNSLFKHFSEVSASTLNVIPNEFFQTIYLQFLDSFQAFQSHELDHAVDSAMSVYLSIKNHMERSEDYHSGQSFQFDSYLIRESSIFLQKYIKICCAGGKETKKLLKMCIMLVDCFIQFITSRLMKFGLLISIKDFDFLRYHFKIFVGYLQKCKRVSEFVELKKELMSKIGLVVRLIDLRDKGGGAGAGGFEQRAVVRGFYGKG